MFSILSIEWTSLVYDMYNVLCTVSHLPIISLVIFKKYFDKWVKQIHIFYLFSMTCETCEASTHVYVHPYSQEHQLNVAMRQEDWFSRGCPISDWFILGYCQGLSDIRLVYSRVMPGVVQ